MKSNQLNQESTKHHPYNTRNRDIIVPAHHKLEFYNKKPTHIGAKYFRNLPDTLRKENDINRFKIQVKNYLLDKPLYSFQEFYEG